MEPWSYLELLGLMARTQMVLTDSSGIQEETTILGVPCLTLRDNTKQPVMVSHGTKEVVSTSPARIVTTALHVLNGNGKKGQCFEHWDDRVAQRIVSILRERLAG
jgi:UDP-N-acetylglucosamine 2-epimerase (non-hydrolysing)